ncbi:AfsR/SARP family transcriptional regulator [Paractinoplanes brasiliensis]|uniref:DNA-binding SARP family transcriptional activator n=1 Tax=Paractinoplanes brasiliensis TaxID=52695 RepID=A0A4R6JL53_9ACTN|nr:BTAD domain-containing putative transcriptional regulator [Actinoplanes brasiliensis]TDO37024.1 DNA-binding SARP family transcriptional activator [Actinoplanes brasiliensis]GID32285.1 SARP family transcriptional regulator [Actinoplanes brasiliensis]
MPSNGGGASVSFGVLGPLRVRRQGTQIDPGARQQRLILALLLAKAGQPVGVGEIVEVLWGPRPPVSAVNVVHRYVGALRRLFEPGLPARSPGHWLLGDAAGYRMRVGPGDLDLLRLRQLAEQARSEDAAGRRPEAMAAYEAALDLWRGPCGGAAELASGDRRAFDLIDHECADLVREAATLALRLRRVRPVLPVLRRVSELRPLDEGLQAQLLLALSADGQQAEAIALYHDVRGRLADELGVDPREELREAYQIVLDQSVGEAGPGAADPSDPIASPGGTLIGRTPGVSAVLPAQLPAELPHFTGRDEAQRRTLGLLNGHVMSQVSTPVLVIDGIPGIGKTTLAIRLAYQLADAYPDGQLYVDLQGFDPEQAMLPPEEALRAFLNALGVPDSDIPASPRARSGLYRSVLAGRRILVVLDNARSVEQVRPLLPGAPGCLVLVTSRKRLTGLATAHGAHLMTLDVLSDEDARQFLAVRIGDTRTSADPDAVAEIAARCGRLPLALAVVAARALAHPDHRLTDIARELRDAQGGLDGFSDDDMGNSIRAIFSWSYRMLSAPAARTFRLLSLHPGPDATVPAIASLAGVPLAEARPLTGELVRTGLLTERSPGRFTTHDLIRAYAHELIRAHEDGPARDDAFRRLASHYRQSAYAADLLLSPTVVLEPPDAPGYVVATRPSTAAEAIAWFSADRQALRAMVHRLLEYGQVATAWRLALSLQRFNQGEGWYHDWATMARACLEATSEAGDDLGRAYSTRSLGGAEMMWGRYDSASRLLRRSLDLFASLGLRPEQALVYRNLGQLSVEQGDDPEAVVLLGRARDIFASLGDRTGELGVLSVLTEAHSNLGQVDVCRQLANRALLIAEQLGDPNALGLSYEALADSCRAAGDLSTALTYWKKATELYRQIGWQMGLTSALLNQGDIALALNDPAGARAAWRLARDLMGNLRTPQVVDKIEKHLNRLTRLQPARSHGSPQV